VTRAELNEAVQTSPLKACVALPVQIAKLGVISFGRMVSDKLGLTKFGRLKPAESTTSALPNFLEEDFLRPRAASVSVFQSANPSAGAHVGVASPPPSPPSIEPDHMASERGTSSIIGLMMVVFGLMILCTSTAAVYLVVQTHGAQADGRALSGIDDVCADMQPPSPSVYLYESSPEAPTRAISVVNQDSVRRHQHTPNIQQQLLDTQPDHRRRQLFGGHRHHPHHPHSPHSHNPHSHSPAAEAVWNWYDHRRRRPTAQLACAFAHSTMEGAHGARLRAITL
jgi:hypothetical protein